MKRFILLLACLVLTAAARANYRFQVPENRCVVTVNKDASIGVRYSITFANEGQPIDIVDVGLPDDNYDLSSVAADLDGVPRGDIRKSEFLASGVEVHLGERSIPAGARGTLNLTALCRGRVFQDREDPAYASMEFSPTWYGSEFTFGTTRLVCEFVLPEGVAPEEPRHHATPFTSARVEEGKVVYTWEIADASPSSQYTFGASFPKRVMDALAEEPKGPGPVEKAVSGFLGIVFGAFVPCGFIGFFVGIAVLGAVQSRRRRMKYLPPKVGMEGVEVRRGLTVPEAAVLMEEKVDKVLACVLFGMVRKGLLRITSRQPLKLELIPGKEAEFAYEKEFAKAVADDGKIVEDEAAKVLTSLIKRVEEKLRGFSRSKSLLYYKDIMRRAWEQVGSQEYSQAFEWLLLDKEFPDRARERFGENTMPVPVWWPAMVTGGRHTGTGMTGGAGLPNPVAAAHSVTSSLEAFGHDLVNSVPGLATKVTKETNPVPVSSGSYSGGGCACACACAGCACACAGGGR